MQHVPEFFAKPAPITDFIDEKTYDIVVVGAGAPGLPAALRAAELGAKVAVVQKEIDAVACGNVSAGLLLDKSNPADVAKVVELLMEESEHKANRDVLKLWAYNSGEAITWLIDQAQKAGCEVHSLGSAPHVPFNKKQGLDLEWATCLFGPKPYNTGLAVMDLARYAEKQGVDFFFKTPARQLVQDESGRVTGVVAESKVGMIKFNATKGVILATGDYANDKDMMDYYLPEMDYMDLKRVGRTGDGHKMIVWAGGMMETPGHTKMVHDMDSGPNSMMSLPYLCVNLDGQRFANETVGMEYMNNYLEAEKDKGHYCQIFDSRYMEQAKAMGRTAEEPESLKNWMPEEDLAERKGVYPGLIDTFKADTLEELAAKLRIRDVDAFIASVKRYNELAHAGSDTDFGVPADKMCPVEEGPFYGTHRHVRFTVGCSGVVINGDLQPVDKDGKPIEGVYAIGNLSGGFYGAHDYPLSIFGINLGRNFTQGYVVATRLASK